uniref:Uncharacterized protein n=1 Tax=Timema bartmani TaxID=61472 RepID=A0A7R9I7D6_9NEOP|nr:unnamed protein product [Timema bartmani]
MLVKLVKENREHLRNENLGITRSAAAFIRLLNAARGAKKEEIVKVLKSSKNKEIISQLYDLAGATQTQEAHDAVMKVLHLDFEYDLDQNERYFWALSLGSHPKLSVIKGIIFSSVSYYLFRLYTLCWLNVTAQDIGICSVFL